ncbi:transposase [Bacillus piscicola]|uniref:transposase n=1 Tax=Bacillus piscicola TaxID=1632684 RepID=UPI001F09877B
MPREQQFWFPGTTYYIKARGVRDLRIFLDYKDYAHYVYLLTKMKAECDFDVHAYALLPNEIHLLLETISQKTSIIMQRLQTGYAMYFNRRHRLKGHVFNGRYAAELVKDETHFFESSRNIHLTPLQEKLVTDLHDYRWCSARDYLTPQPEDTPNHPVLTLDRTLRLFPSPKHNFYHEFIHQPLQK